MIIGLGFEVVNNYVSVFLKMEKSLNITKSMVLVYSHVFLQT